MLSNELIHASRQAIAPHLHRTPVWPSRGLSDLLGVPVWLKCEHHQVTGSFKVRGALFRLAQLTPSERARGVITCSAGNHGKGLAWAAQKLGVDAVIHVPSSVDAAKLDGMLACGATVRVSDLPGYDATEKLARADARSSGRVWVSAFDDPWIMAGNGGTLGAEVLEQVPDVRSIIVPVSGGGLSAGLSWAVHAHDPGIHVVGAQHRHSPGFALSLERGHAVTELAPIDTVAGGIEGGVGELTFQVLRDHVRECALADEAQILQAVRWLLAEHQTLVEPSGAVTVAAALAGELPELRGPVVFVLSGRNVGWQTLRGIVGGVGG